jgi:hypothetical protein
MWRMHWKKGRVIFSGHCNNSLLYVPGTPFFPPRPVFPLIVFQLELSGVHGFISSFEIPCISGSLSRLKAFVNLKLCF